MRVFRIGLMVGVLAIMMAPSAAQAQYGRQDGTLQVAAATVAPGGSVAISGAGFAPGSDVVITIESTPTTLGSVRANGSGEFSTRVQIPSGMTGSHTLKATGVTPDGATLVLSQDVVVQAAGALARTGADGLVPMTVAAMGLVLLGVSAIWFARSRSHS